MSSNESVLTFEHPKDGHRVTLNFHPSIAGQMRLYYERKGFKVVDPNAPETPVAAEPDVKPYVPIRNRKQS
jgi:hypothetical protein